MTKRELVRRVDHWRLLLAPEWRITIDASLDAPADAAPGARAVIQADDDYHHARLWLAPETRAGGRGELDVTLVHELLHLELRELRRTIDLIDGHVHRELATMLDERWTSLEEQTVDRLSRIIARLEHPAGLVYGVDLDD